MNVNESASSATCSYWHVNHDFCASFSAYSARKALTAARTGRAVTRIPSCNIRVQVAGIDACQPEWCCQCFRIRGPASALSREGMSDGTSSWTTLKLEYFSTGLGVQGQVHPVNNLKFPFVNREPAEPAERPPANLSTAICSVPSHCRAGVKISASLRRRVVHVPCALTSSALDTGTGSRHSSGRPSFRKPGRLQTIPNAS